MVWHCDEVRSGVMRCVALLCDALWVGVFRCGMVCGALKCGAVKSRVLHGHGAEWRGRSCGAVH